MCVICEFKCKAWTCECVRVWTCVSEVRLWKKKDNSYQKLIINN